MDEPTALIAHAFHLKPERGRLFIKCTNAFNHVDRAEAARAIIAKCPRLAKYCYLLYQEDTNILIRGQAPIVFGFGYLSTYTNAKSLLDTKDNSIFGVFFDDSAISAAHKDTVDAFDSYKSDGPENGLHINYGKNKTVVLLGKCEDDAETYHRITAYSVCGIPFINIKIHPDNGGSEAQYGYINLGVPVGYKYQLNYLNSLVDQFIETSKCDEIV
jgi:hypothetical protein